MYLARSPFAMPRMYNYSLAPAKRFVVKQDFNQSIVVPKANIYEDQNKIYFEFEIPGVAKEDINIRINDEKVLSLTAKRNIRSVNSEEQENKYYEFKRSFKLDGEFLEDQINAKYNDGVLILELPKRHAVEKLIEIN